MDNKQPNQTIEFPSPLVQREPDDEIAKRALSLLRWKIRYNAIRVKAEKGHVTSLRRGQLGFGPRSSRTRGTQAERSCWNY